MLYMICELQIKIFFHPFGILWYKFLSYIEVLCVLSEFSKLLELSELIELPEVFSSMKKCLFHGALRLGDPLIKLLELRFVSSSSETSRSSGTIQTSQSSISSHPVFPDVVVEDKVMADVIPTQPKGKQKENPIIVPTLPHAPETVPNKTKSDQVLPSRKAPLFEVIDPKKAIEKPRNPLPHYKYALEMMKETNPEEVFQKLMDQPVTMKLGEIIGLSYEIGK